MWEGNGGWRREGGGGAKKNKQQKMNKEKRKRNKKKARSTFVSEGRERERRAMVFSWEGDKERRAVISRKMEIVPA